MRTILFLSALALVSCSQFDYYADGTSKIERAHFVTLGGSSALDTAGGTRLTQNHVKSFGQAAQAVVAIAGGLSATANLKSNNSLESTKTLSAAKTAQQQAALNAQAAKDAAALAAKEGAFKAALEKGAVPSVGTVTPP